MTAAIARVRSRRVWDSRGRPTVEAEVWLDDGSMGRAIAAAGESAGRHESPDRRDGGVAFGGYDVQQALRAIEAFAPRLRGLDTSEQRQIDAMIAGEDGTPTPGLGTNARIVLSTAVARASASSRRLPLHAVLGDGKLLPMPEIQIFGGGAHARGSVDIQDFMVIPIKAESYGQALEWCAEIYRHAGERLRASGRLHGVADDGGYWPLVDRNEDVLVELEAAIELAGFSPGTDVGIAIDVAASQLYSEGRYFLARDGVTLDADGLGELLLRWCERYSIVSIEDPFHEDEVRHTARLVEEIGERVQITGDDLTATDPARIDALAAERACNATLIKPSQNGTLTGTRWAFERARAAGWAAVVAGRSGDTEDVSIMHVAVAWGAPQLKLGGFARSERMAKWNEGLRIAESWGDGGRLAPQCHAPWGRV